MISSYFQCVFLIHEICHIFSKNFYNYFPAIKYLLIFLNDYLISPVQKHLLQTTKRAFVSLLFVWKHRALLRIPICTYVAKYLEPYLIYMLSKLFAQEK